MSRRPDVVSVLEAKPRLDGRPKPYPVRWVLNGQEYGKSFSHSKLAQTYKASLVIASHDPKLRWNPRTGEPVSWDKTKQLDVATFCKSYIAREAPTYEPKSIASVIEALTAFIEAARTPRAPMIDPAWRPMIRAWLSPTNEVVLKKEIETWIMRYSMSLSDLDEASLLRIDEELRHGVNGKPLGRRTASHRVATVKRVLRRARKEKLIAEIPWPEPELGESSRKANTSPTHPDILVPNPVELSTILDAIISHQPATHMYRAMTAVGAYAGLRPGEVVALEVKDLVLPDNGWGSISVTKAWVATGTDVNGAIGKTKTTGEREVPIPPLLVNELRRWLEHAEIQSGPIFRTRNGRRPTQSNWGRVLKRATSLAQTTPVTPYGLRHTCASFMNASGVPIAEAAARMGHSAETMLRFYTHRVAGHEHLSNLMLEEFFSTR